MTDSLLLGTDSRDYSRYDPVCDTIQVFGAVDNAHLGETLTVSLSRNDSYGVVATHELPSITSSFTTSFALNSSEMNDADGYNRATQGDYTVTATLPDETHAQVPLTVSLVSVNELRNNWLYGLTTFSSEIVLPKVQPREFPAVFLMSSPSFVKDFYDLVWDKNTSSLSFAGGPAMVIPANKGLQEIILLDGRQQDWVHLRINTFKLPTQDVTETLIMDQAYLGDDAFIHQMRLATDWIETKMGFLLEPRVVVSEHMIPTQPKYERVLDGASFYDDFDPYRGVFPNISLPFQWLLRVYALEGWYNQKKVLTMPQVWIQRGPMRQGDIELVPTSGQAMALTWESFPFAFAASNSRCVPGFWQYGCLAGLPDLHGDRGIIRELIAKKAGCNLALSIATAYRAGISSRSTSRDNISISESYTSSAMYSILAHLTIPWEEFIKDNIPVARRHIGGLPVVTLI